MRNFGFIFKLKTMNNMDNVVTHQDQIDSFDRRLSELELRITTLEEKTRKRLHPGERRPTQPIHIPPPTPINTPPSGYPPITYPPSGEPLGNIKDLLPRPPKGPPPSNLHPNTSAGVIADLRRQIDEKDKIIKEQRLEIERYINTLKDVDEKLERLSSDLIRERLVTESQREDIAKYKAACDYYIRLNFETVPSPTPENSRPWWDFRGWS